MYYVYLLQCSDDSIYCGITTDLERRLQEHKNGVGSKYTRAHKAGKIVYTEEVKDRSAASKREAGIKKMSREDKLKLISNK